MQKSEVSKMPFREAVLKALSYSGLTIMEVAQLAGVHRGHLERVALGMGSLHVRDTFRRKVASAFARTGKVPEEVIEAVSGGQPLYIDIMVDHSKIGDLYQAIVYNETAKADLHALVADGLPGAYSRLASVEDQHRFIEFLLFWIRRTYYGMNSKRRVEETREILLSHSHTDKMLLNYIQHHRGVFDTMAFTLTFCCWRNMALLFPFIQDRPPYLNLLPHRKELPGPIVSILESSMKRLNKKVEDLASHTK